MFTSVRCLLTYYLKGSGHSHEAVERKREYASAFKRVIFRPMRYSAGTRRNAQDAPTTQISSVVGNLSGAFRKSIHREA